MDNGWIKLHRKVMQNVIWRRSTYAHLWVTILLKANHKPETIMWNDGILIIKDGQLLTGRKQLALETGIAETTIERALDFLEKNGFIGQQTTTKYRVITILNWRDYQQADNKRTASGQQADTNKNVKNVKNDKNNTPAQGADGGVVGNFIHLFKDLNPSIGTLYGRPPQRAAAERLLKLHPFEWWERFIAAYQIALQDRYCPRATTPIKMEERLGEIMAYGRQKRSGNKGKGIISSVEK